MQSVKEPQRSTLPDSTPVNAVRAQVERIVANSGFATSERHTKLLRHLVSMSLAGRGGEIKEYALGVDLFARGESFDPQTDAIVRTEVSRLRAKLKAYYSADGRDDPLIIDLPNRSYVPVITPREPLVTAAASAPAQHNRRWLSFMPALALAGTVGVLVFFRLGPVSATAGQSRPSDAAISVAVLPFVISETDPKLEQFADSLTDEVIETLAEMPGLRVASRTSALQFKGKEEDIGAVAAKLNVESVLEGSVRRSGDKLRITARLVNAGEGHQYYSYVYEHELDDAITGQREIAAHVANVLRVREKGQEVAGLTKNGEAHQRYLQGLNHASHLSESELTQAVDCFQKAIGYDPNYSPAYTGLADAYITLALMNEGPHDAMERAADAAKTAVKTGPGFAHAHAALGSVLALYQWDWAGAEREFRSAIEKDPDDSPILQQYAMRYLVPQANLDSALFELRRAQRVDPFSPLVVLNRGWVQYYRRAPERALTDIRAALEFEPELETGPLALAEVDLLSSRFNEAEKTLQESTAPTEDEIRLAALGSVYGLSRQPERARKVLEQLQELDRHYQHVSGYYFSQIYIALGEISSALKSLEQAAEEHSPMVVYAKVDPQFERLHSEPRFRNLLKKIGLEK